MIVFHATGDVREDRSREVPTRGLLEVVEGQDVAKPSRDGLP
jgi:hypothetical protein